MDLKRKIKSIDAHPRVFSKEKMERLGLEWKVT